MIITHRQSLALSCPQGHWFTADVLVTLNAGVDADLLYALNADGSQPITCPACALSWSISEPSGVFLSATDAWALLVPHALLHRAVELRAAALQQLRTLPPAHINADIFDMPVRSLEAIRELVQRTSAPEAMRAVSEAPSAAGIARAFADLDSVPPPSNRK